MFSNFWKILHLFFIFEIEFSTKFAYLLAMWLISCEDAHITEKPQSDNKTARKSTDPAYMKKLEQQLRVTSAYNPVF